MPSFVARRYDTLRPVQISHESGRITAIVPAEESQLLPIVAPGLVDLQVNGYGGVEFNSPTLTVEEVARAALAHDAFGVTSLLATCTTDSFELLARSFRVIAEARRTRPDVALRIPGIHLEGPYISSQDGPRGAHPLQHVRAPDWDEFRRLQEAAEGAIRLLTVSPEYDNAPEFIARVADSGVLVAVGHTAANSDQIRAAVDAGARMSTHLGNGAHPQIRRHPNYIWDQLAEDRLTASLITDGHHLPPAVVQTMFRAKTLSRCVLVSDITALAGMPAGRYSTGLGEVELLPSGKLVPAGQPQLLAGASLPLHGCVPLAMKFGGLSLAQAVDLASRQPARLIGHDGGRLDVGAPATLTLFDFPSDLTKPLHIRATLHAGECVFGAANT
jgi:N-acetylglucosamine-6-phosphate deacetylase